MGDRVSISFVKKSAFPEVHGEYSESVALFSHWDGMGFVLRAQNYIRENLRVLQTIRKKGMMYPIDRGEPETVILDFISTFLAGERVSHNYYLGKDGDDGDNSDNGHYRIDVDTGELV